jgi:hypothetical protein
LYYYSQGAKANYCKLTVMRQRYLALVADLPLLKSDNN